MKETSDIPQENFFSSGYNSSEELEENNFNSSEIKPENIFSPTNKENPEQLSSIILYFPFKLDSYQIIKVKSKDAHELGGKELLIILGNLDKIKNNEILLKLIFSSKDKNESLNLKNYQKEMNSLLNIGLDFIGIFQNILFIKYENDNATNEAYISLQKSYILFDLLYEEDNTFNYTEDKDSNDKKNIKNIEDKKEEKNPINNNICSDESCLNNDVKNISNKKLDNLEEIINQNTQNNLNNINIKRNLFPQNNKIIKDQPQNIKQTNQMMLPSQIYPNNLFQNNNYQKIPPFNPLLSNQLVNPNNPFFIQTALIFQNYIRLQQQFQLNNKINNSSKDVLNNIKNYAENNNINNNTIKINMSNNKNNNYSPQNQKESSTNSNSSTASSKDSSPIMNYQSKINNNNLLNTNNNNIKNFKIESNKILSNNNNDKNLEEIVENKQYKEYFPKNQKNLKEKENDVQFQTNSTRDYQYKYVSRYIVQIENEKNFPVTKMIIGNNGMLLRKILLDNCIKYGDHTTKIRLRGKGSGYKEGINNEESKDPMELCISSLNVVSFSRCSSAIENLLLQIYYHYYLYQTKNVNNLNNKLTNTPIVMKKILKYHYVVNRYNTLVKEEKRRRKEEEEANKKNQNKEKNCDNSNNNNNNNFNYSL